VALLENPTIRELAKAITASGWSPSWNSLVNLKARGSQAPLFLIHAIGGDVLSYRNLVIHLSDLDRPIYGLRAQGLDGITPPLERVEDMAARYLQEIRAVQPHGPYFLGGYSFGGTVASRWHSNMRGWGKDCVIGDVRYLGHGKPSSQAQTRKLTLALDLIERIWFVIEKWFGLSWSKKADYFKKMSHILSRYFRAFWKHEVYVNPQEEMDRERWRRKPVVYQKVEDISQKALCAYVTKPYEGSVAYFKAHPAGMERDGTAEPLWRKLALGGLKVYRCEGNHDTIMIEPNVQSLAIEMKKALKSMGGGQVP
jgi:thioesterase domain-containing protein